MDLDKIYKTVAAVAGDSRAPLPSPDEYEEFADLVAVFRDIVIKNRKLEKENRDAISYIRQKVDQLLTTIGTSPLRPEELDDKTLLQQDPIGVVAETFVQILEHLRTTNDDLRRTRKQLEALFESVDAAILLLDKDMHILAYNKGFQQMFSVPEKTDPLGLYCRDLICQEESTPLNCSFRKMLTTGSSARNFEWPYKDRFLSVVASPIKDKNGNITSGVLLYQDITEQRKDKAELANEKERLAITLRSIAEGVITMNIENKIFMMNEIAEKLTGYGQEEAVGLPADEIFWLVDQQHRNQTIRLSGDLLAQQEPTDITILGVLISREGDERLINASAAPILDAEGIVNGVVIVFRDITEEKRLEKEITNARRLESMGVLAGGIAHDFNNLLTGILGNISLARMTEAVGSKSGERLIKAEQACHRAQELTYQLLAFAKGGTPIRKTMSISELIRETCQFALRGMNVKCLFYVAKDLWLIKADEGQIGQVFHNLALNACQAMPEGGTIEAHAENIELDAHNPYSLPMGKYIKVEIIDSGQGIPTDIRDKIFDPYFTTKTTGSGLGLASSYSIVKRHGGHIAVESTPGGGSTFSILLPASTIKDHPREKRKDKTKEAAELDTKKILLMDDDAGILDLVQGIFAYLGQEFSLAKDGQEAVDLYRQALDAGEPYDVVILDLTVPGGIGGKEALQILQKIDPGIRAIVSSGYSSDDAMEKYLDLGFMGVVPKPYKVQRLVEEINRVIHMQPPGRKNNLVC